jgi:hypothetical protein
MYFCPKCNYTFDITKSNSTDNTDKIIIKKVSEAFKIFEIEKNFNNYKAEFNLEDLEKNSKYKKISKENKEEFLKLFQLSNIPNAQFQCNNCNFIKEINQSILLYEYNINESVNSVKSLEENELTCQNPILPRTHDYICKNINCLTHKKEKNIKKEAVFIRDKDTYRINYICCVCFYSW